MSPLRGKDLLEVKDEARVVRGVGGGRSGSDGMTLPPPPTCPDCGRTFTFASALGQHRTWCWDNSNASKRREYRASAREYVARNMPQPSDEGGEPAFFCEPCSQWHPIVWKHIGGSLHHLAPVEVSA